MLNNSQIKVVIVVLYVFCLLTLCYRIYHLKYLQIINKNKQSYWPIKTDNNMINLNSYDLILYFFLNNLLFKNGIIN